MSSEAIIFQRRVSRRVGFTER